MIRFGSRTEVFVPDSVSLKVSVGEKVKAGESIVGEVRDD
jgi:phosphatidylserine decarboxylase